MADDWQGIKVFYLFKYSELLREQTVTKQMLQRSENDAHVLSNEENCDVLCNNSDRIVNVSA